jgi:hypothetical protein
MRVTHFGRIRWLVLVLILLAALTFPVRGYLHARQASSSAASASVQPFVVEYYYRTKWGHADEFITLFKKNHYPVLKREMEMGRILKVYAVAPRYHSTEDGRWDYRTTIVFKNADIAHDNFDTAALLKQMFPDQETYRREEQHRFEILDAHWDVPIKDVDLDSH